MDAFFRNDFRVYDGEAFAITTSRVANAAFLNKCLLVDQTAAQAAGLHALQHYQDRVAVAVVDRVANLSQAAAAIVRSKTAFGGTSPFAADVVLVNEWIRQDFIAELERKLSMKLQKGPKLMHSKAQDNKAAVAEKEEVIVDMNGVLVAEIPRP